jgi:uncharacterized DUF497 family protein
MFNSMKSERYWLTSPVLDLLKKDIVQENVYAVMGQTDSGRRLIIFFVYKTDKRALILSARDMTKAERKLYEKT